MIKNTHRKLKNRNFLQSELILGVSNVSDIIRKCILVYAMIFPRHHLEFHLVRNKWSCFISAVLFKISITTTSINQNIKINDYSKKHNFQDSYKWGVEMNLKRQRYYIKICFYRMEPGAKHMPVQKTTYSMVN